MSIAGNIDSVKKELGNKGVKLIVVSKTQSIPIMEEVLSTGHRIFGENQVQELVEKYEALPKDIEWHLIGHLQTNKVKYIAPFISLIHSVDSLKLLEEINKQALKSNRIIPCLLQVHIADEETKFGFAHEELIQFLELGAWKNLKNIQIHGLMGIATNTPNRKIIQEEFYEFQTFFKGIQLSYFRQDSFFKELSIGMSSDYLIAIEYGSTMVRIGSAIFGKRKYKEEEL